MNISYNWLKEYIDLNLTPEETAKALTACGLEVGGIEEKQSIKGGLKGLFTGKVLTCEKHPDSDHLHITTVDIGKSEPSQIVCGAPNVAAGQHVIVADIGCVLYDGDKEFVIKKSKLRGAESYGMICAEDEIGVGDSHDGIIVLPENTPVGVPAADYYKVTSDYILEIDLTANRADALSHYGVARDLYAWLKQNGYQTAIKRPSSEGFTPDNNDLPIKVSILNQDACQRYACVSLTGCEVKESPRWLQEKLENIGIRPVNNIVDITNYVMMAYGQPMHCFDADMVKDHHIIVKTLKEGTPFITLDQEKHLLGDHDLCICSEEEPMCIAGIFGGKGSGTYENTKNIVLESAYFTPSWIRKSARKHGLSTDASYRFERGVDPNITIYALQQAALLCRELAGGKIAMSINDVYPNPIKEKQIDIKYTYIYNLIGKNIGEDQVKNILTNLDIKILSEDQEGLKLSVPTYRVEVTRPCDIVEEILRIYGYNNIEIPENMLISAGLPGEADRGFNMERLIGEQLIGAGFNEILNNSLTKSAYYQDLNHYEESNNVKILNPLSSELNVMRQTLLFGGLESIMRNVNRQALDLSLFEFGNCYHFDSNRHNEENPIKAYREEKHLGLWITGKKTQNTWTHPDENTTFEQLKAYVLNIFARLGLNENALIMEQTDNNIYKSAICYKTKSGETIASLGVVASKIRQSFDLNNDVFYADINWNNLMKVTRNQKPKIKEIAKYPAVKRDLALLIDKNIQFVQIKELAEQTEKKLLKRVELFDVYEGKNIPQGKKSYAVNFVLQDENATLKDKQIETVMNKIIFRLKKELNAELR